MFFIFFKFWRISCQSLKLCKFPISLIFAKKGFGILSFVFVLMQVTSDFAFADKIQGRFLCKTVFLDGSSLQSLIDVGTSEMTIQDLKYPIKNSWALIHKDDFSGIKVFEGGSQVIILSPKDNGESLEKIRHGFYSDADDKLVRGLCDRTFVE